MLSLHLPHPQPLVFRHVFRHVFSRFIFYSDSRAAALRSIFFFFLFLTQATKEQIEDLFSAQGPIKEVKLIKNYGFIEFEGLDDAVRAKENVDGQQLNGEPLFCTYANPIKVREPRVYRDRNDRPERGGDRKEEIFRVNISGLAPGVSWQDLKDFGRTAEVEVTYTNVSRDREGEGTVEFRSADQMEQAVSKLDGTEFQGEIVTMKIDVSKAGAT